MSSHPHQKTGAHHRLNRACSCLNPYVKKTKLIYLAVFWLGFNLLVGTPASPIPLEVDPRINVALTAADYPDSDSVLLLDDIAFSVSPDRSSVFDEHDAIRILNPEGISSNASLDRIIDEDKTSIEVLVARTIKQDGRILNAPKPTLKELANNPKAYSSIKRFTISFPDVQVGDSIEFHLRTIHKPRAGGHFWATTYIQNPMPMLDSRFTVTIPTGMYYRIATPGLEAPLPPRETITLNGTSYSQQSWHVQNVKPFTPQQLSPPILSLLSRIEVSSFKDWNEVASYIGTKWQQESTISEGLAMRVAGWLPATSDPVAKSQAIIKEISEKRRTIYLLSEEFNFHRPSQVYPERQVSLGDSALLLSTVLAWAGIANVPIATLGVSLDSLKSELPNPEKVDRIVLELPLSGRNSVWIDPRNPGFVQPTPPYKTSGLAAISWDKRFNTGDNGLGLIKTPTPYSSREEIAIEGRIDKNGRTELTLQHDSYGTRTIESRQAMRDFKDLSSQARERELNLSLASTAELYGDRARVLSHYMESDPYAKDPFSVALTLAIPGYGKVEGQTLAAPLPRFIAPDIRTAILNKKRDTPLSFDTPYQRDARIHVIFPKDSTVIEAPPFVHKKSAGAEFMATSRISGNEVWYVGRLTLRKDWIAKEDIAQTLEVLRAAAQNEDSILKATLASTPSDKQGASEGAEDSDD